MARYRDCDGDVWAQTSVGDLVIVESATGSIGVEIPSLNDLKAEYGPLVELDAPRVAPVTRAELAAFCTELGEVFQEGNDVVDVRVVLSAWAQRMGGEA